MTSSGWLIRHARPGDEGAIVEVVNRAFAQHDAGFKARDVAWFSWKYAGNPRGRHNIVIEDPDGKIVGHYGGVPIAMRVGGSGLLFGQNCDSVSDPLVRRGLRNPGAFVRLAQAYASTFGRSGQSAVMYGVPVPEHYRIGARYLDYWMLRAQPLLVCRSPAGLPPWAPDVHAIPVDAFPGDVDEAFERIAPQYDCVARRDAAFLNWRFRDHFERPYRMAVARHGNGGPLRGHVVYRTGTFAGRVMGLVVDWFVAHDDDLAARSLLRWATERAAQDGQDEVGFLCPPSSFWFERFQDMGFEVDRSPYVTVARPYDQRFPPAWLRDHWYYTLADLDIA